MKKKKIKLLTLNTPSQLRLVLILSLNHFFFSSVTKAHENFRQDPNQEDRHHIRR